MSYSGSTEPIARWELDSLKRDFDEKLRRLKSDLDLERSERTMKWSLTVITLVGVVLWTVMITLAVVE